MGQIGPTDLINGSFVLSRAGSSIKKRWRMRLAVSVSLGSSVDALRLWRDPVVAGLGYEDGAWETARAFVVSPMELTKESTYVEDPKRLPAGLEPCICKEKVPPWMFRAILAI